MTTSTCLNRRLSPLSDAPVLGGREEKRKRDTESNDRSLLVFLVLPLLPHNSPSDGESSPWATGHVVYSPPGCPALLLFLSFTQRYFCIY